MKPSKSYLLAIFALIVSCLAFLLLSYISYNRLDQMASAYVSEKRPTIVIDAGHGGEDGGAEGKSKLLEKEINLNISKQLQNLLQASGFRVIMIRTEDVSIGDPSLGTIKERKISDLHNRLKIIEEQGDCIFISIHQNHFSDGRYSGAQMFYSLNNEKSKELAEYIKSRVVSLLQPENKRECKPATSSIYLLWQTEVPAVLVECGFLSNDSEAQKLNDPDYQKQMAFSIYSGFMDYYGSLS